jgi:hypothetical protein
MSLDSPAVLAGQPLRDKLSPRLWLFVGLSVVVIFCEMLGGYAGSWVNLQDAASRAGWALPWLLPLLADLPILAYVILDQIAVILGSKARGLHYLAWAMAAFTVWANYEVSPASSTTWRIIYAAMPAGWVAGVEALRWFWRLLHKGPRPVKDRIPAGRWVAAPLETRRVQWRMWKLGERSWRRMSAIEDARAVAFDVVRELEAADRVAPAYLTARIRSARLPGPVLDAIDTALRYRSGTAPVEASVRDWVASQMVLPEWVKISLELARRTVAQEAAGNGPELPAGNPSEEAADNPSAKRSGNPPETAAGRRLKKPTAAAVKRMSAAQLAPHVEQYAADLAEQGTEIKIQHVMDYFHVARAKARGALAIASDKGAPVIQLGARQECAQG